MDNKRKPMEPLPLSSSQYGIGTEVPMRAKDLPDVGAVLIEDLFPRRNGRVLFPAEGGFRSDPQAYGSLTRGCGYVHDQGYRFC